MSQRQSKTETKLDALLQQSLMQDNKQVEILNLLRQVLGATGETNRKMSIFRSPPQGRASPAKRAASPGNKSELCVASHGEGPSKRSRDGLQSQDDMPAPQQLHYGTTADANNTGAANNKGKRTVGGIVKWFHAEGKLKA
jgi:alkylhydroperoxidase family enzyme